MSRSRYHGTEISVADEMTQGAAPIAPSAAIAAGIPWSGILAGLAAAAIWGAWPVASRFGVQQTLTPMDLTMVRFLVAGLILLPIVLRQGHGGLGWGRAFVLAIGAGAPYMLVTSSGFTFAPAGHGGLIIPGFMLTTSTLAGWLILKDAPDRKRWIGLAIVLSGVATMASAAVMDSTGFDALWKGHLLFAGGGLLWASYTVASRKWTVAPLHATALVSVISLVLFAPVYLVQRGTAFLQAPLGELLFQGLAQGVFSAVLALLFYTKAVAVLGAGRAAVFGALVPGLAALFAYPALGEIPSMRHLVGLGLVAVGTVLALGLLTRRRKS